MNATADSLARTLYHDRQLDMDAVKVLPGEFFVTDKDMVLVTVLGSCVSACIRDRQSAIGGMNHFMLPDAGSAPASGSARYGINAMEMMLNELYKRGARKQRLEAKVFGGGNVLASIVANQVGTRNADFVKGFLATEGIPVVGSDLLEEHPRKVYYFPASGKARVKALHVLANDTLLERELDYRSRLAATPASGDIELFG